MASQNTPFMLMVISLNIGAKDIYAMRTFTRWWRLLLGLAFVSLVAIATPWGESAGTFLVYLAACDLWVYTHSRYDLLRRHESRTCCTRAVFLDQVMVVSLCGALSSAVGAGVLNELVANSVALGPAWAIISAAVLQVRDVWVLRQYERTSYA